MQAIFKRRTRHFLEETLSATDAAIHSSLSADCEADGMEADCNVNIEELKKPSERRMKNPLRRCLSYDEEIMRHHQQPLTSQAHSQYDLRLYDTDTNECFDNVKAPERTEDEGLHTNMLSVPSQMDTQRYAAELGSAGSDSAGHEYECEFVTPVTAVHTQQVHLELQSINVQERHGSGIDHWLENGYGETKEQTARDWQTVFGHYIERIRTRMASHSFLIIAVIVLLAFIMFVSLLPPSVVYLDYDKIALLRYRTSRFVDTKKTYYPGCYFLQPDAEFVTFDSTAHFLHFDNVSVTTREPITFEISLSLQYFIRPEQLGELFEKYEHGYDDILRKMVISTFKNRIVHFDLDEIRLNRSYVSRVFHHLIQQKLGGDCCLACCSTGCSGLSADYCYQCVTGDSCNRGNHVDLRYFQVLQTTIPQDVKNIYMRQLLELVWTETEKHKQQHMIETKQTDLIVQAINNDALLLKSNATAQGMLIRSRAESDADAVKQLATKVGFSDMCQQLGITSQQHQLSLFYINSLRNMQHSFMATDFTKAWKYT